MTTIELLEQPREIPGPPGLARSYQKAVGKQAIQEKWNVRNDGYRHRVGDFIVSNNPRREPAGGTREFPVIYGGHDHNVEARDGGNHRQ